MKNLIIALTLFVLPLSAQAQATEPDEFYMPNDSGGWVTLTRVKCGGGAYGMVAYAYAYSSDAAIYGCWVLVNKMVHVQWHNGTNRIYEASDFAPVKDPRRLRQQ